MPLQQNSWFPCAVGCTGMVALALGILGLMITGWFFIRPGWPGIGQTPAATSVGVARTTAAVTPTPGIQAFKLYRGQGMTIMLPNSFISGNLTTDLDWMREFARRNNASADDLSAFASNRDLLTFFAYDFGSSGKNDEPFKTVLATRESTFAGVTLDMYMQVAQGLALKNCNSCRIDHVQKLAINGNEGSRFDVTGPTSAAHRVCYVVKFGVTFWTVIYSTGANRFQADGPLFEQSIQTLTLYGSGTPMPTESGNTAGLAGETPDLAMMVTQTAMAASPTRPAKPATPRAAATRTPAPALPQSAAPTGVATAIPTATATPLPPSPTPLPTSTPTPTKTPACDNPNAHISSPVKDATISGITPFIGVATGKDFLYYKIQYMPESFYGSGLWGELYQGNSPLPQPGTLMEWKTSTVAPGIYWLRLIVADRTGNYPDPCEVRVKVAP